MLIVYNIGIWLEKDAAELEKGKGPIHTRLRKDLRSNGKC